MYVNSVCSRAERAGQPERGQDHARAGQARGAALVDQAAQRRRRQDHRLRDRAEDARRRVDADQDRAREPDLRQGSHSKCAVLELVIYSTRDLVCNTSW